MLIFLKNLSDFRESIFYSTVRIAFSNGLQEYFILPSALILLGYSKRF